ncbi:phosphate propanoyltransferase [Clostridium cochlearium]|uniref:phosphate propanoyltransferase n=1 Tax=Clostridium cochlearium TaxID=1494 RepID=UPI0031400B8B
MTGLQEKLVEEIAKEFIKKYSVKNREYSIPIGVSNRHVHLTKEDIEILFGRGYKLTIKSMVNQPGQFGANETITIAGPKGAFHNVRILGPIRNYSQVEISRSDAYYLGLKAPLRNSGELESAEDITLIGPKGMKVLKSGLICAKRHIHMTPEDSKAYGVKSGDYVQVETLGEKGIIFKNVLIRVSDTAALEFHIDLDEANCCEIKTGEKVRILGLDR